MIGILRTSLSIPLMAVIMLSAWSMAADVVHTTDGRVLEGEIVRETDRLIVFRYVDPTLGYEATITLPMSTIEKIERNVKTDEPEKPTTPDTPASTPKPSKPVKSADITTDTEKAATEGDDTVTRSGRATTFYVVPMKGQVGTDITERIYEQIVEDIKEHNPDVLILNLDSSNLRNEFQEGSDDIIEGDSRHFDPYEQNAWDAENIRAVRTMFEDELPKDIRQVLWVRDAVGSSAIYALAWPEMYMHPEANLGGMSTYVMMYRNAAGDENVKAKFGDAAFGWIRGITQYGNDPDNPNPTRLKLVTALSKPEAYLSVWWKGRMPMWRNDLRGDVAIDIDDESAVIIPSYICDDLCLSDGTAETMDDLAVLLGERNYRIIEGESQTIVQMHHEQWRQAWDRALDAYRNYLKWMGRLSGRSRLANIGKAEKELKRLLALTKKWPEVRSRSGGRFNETDLEIRLEELQRLRRQSGGGSGSGGSGGGGGRLGR